MKRDYITIVCVAILVVFASLFSYYNKPEALGAGGPFNNVKQYLTVDATPYYSHAVATTSETNLILVGTASSTYAFASDSSDQVNFNFLTVNGASSTPATTGAFISNTPLDLVYCYDFSDDQVSWFPLASNCASWNSGVIATSTLGVAVTNVNSKYMRISFSSTMATSTRVGLWAQAITKKGF
jgi:hypothetical protein